MPWTEITRPQYEWNGRRYASDASDEEWALITPLLLPRRAVGRPRTTDLRDVIDAILYMAATGCQWRMLPNDFPPVSTVRRYFYDWRKNGLLRKTNHHLVMAARVPPRGVGGRALSPRRSAAHGRECIAGGQRRASVEVRVARPGTEPKTNDDR